MSREGIGTLLKFAMFLVILSCGGGGQKGSPAPVENPVLLEGAPASLGLDAFVDKSPVTASKSVIQEDGTLLDRLDCFLSSVATVSQVNEAIQSIGALGILSMKKGYPYLTIGLKPQENLQALEKLAAQLKATGVFEEVFPGKMKASDVTPGGGNLDPQEWNHFFSIRLHAAWNIKDKVKNCNGSPIPILVFDYFNYDENGNSNLTDFAPGFQLIGSNRPAGARFHGNNVVGLIAGQFDDSMPIGVNPIVNCVALRGVQMYGLSMLQQNQYMREMLLELLQEFPNAPLLINMSMSFGDSGRRPLYNRMRLAVAFEDMMSGFLANDHMLISSSAGNDRQTGITPGAQMALYTSEQNMATLNDPFFENLFQQREQLFSGVQPNPEGGDPIPNGISEEQYQEIRRFIQQRGTDQIPPAFNVIMAGSADSIGTAERPELSQESVFSNSGSDLLLVGEGIPSVEEGRGNMVGTSFTTPQVTGLVSYLWLLSPELRGMNVQTTKNLLSQNKWPGTEIVDAYAAALSLDEAALPTPQSTPMRLALMDVDNNERFDEVDVQLWLEAIHFHEDLPVQERLDYSRYDLNGDGYIGGRDQGALQGRASPRFDLDRVGSQKFGMANYGQVTKNILGNDITFDENRLRDLDILCYYTYSDLYTGSEQYRNGVDDIMEIGLIAYLCNPHFLPRLPGDPLPLGPGDQPGRARITILPGSNYSDLSRVLVQIDSPRGFDNASLRTVLRKAPYHGERGRGAYCAEPWNEGFQVAMDVTFPAGGCAQACPLPAFNTNYCTELQDCPCVPDPFDPTKCIIPEQALPACQGWENCRMKCTLFLEFKDRLNWLALESRCFLCN